MARRGAGRRVHGSVQRSERRAAALARLPLHLSHRLWGRHRGAVWRHTLAIRPLTGTLKGWPCTNSNGGASCCAHLLALPLVPGSVARLLQQKPAKFCFACHGLGLCERFGPYSLSGTGRASSSLLFPLGGSFVVTALGWLLRLRLVQ